MVLFPRVGACLHETTGARKCVHISHVLVSAVGGMRADARAMEPVEKEVCVLVRAFCKRVCVFHDSPAISNVGSRTVCVRARVFLTAYSQGAISMPTTWLSWRIRWKPSVPARRGGPFQM